MLYLGCKWQRAVIVRLITTFVNFKMFVSVVFYICGAYIIQLTFLGNTSDTKDTHK